MEGGKQTRETVRHRLLEGLLARLARTPYRDQFVLRGGMLMRMWFRPFVRSAHDLDFACTEPFDIDETEQRLVPLLATQVDDGVQFDRERHRVQGIWLNTEFPGVRIYATGQVKGVAAHVHIDVTFGELLVPPPRLVEYSFESSEARAVWICRPETIMGRKLHALWHMGMQHWRPKDLNDIRLLLETQPMNMADLVTAIAASFTSRGDVAEAAHSLFLGEPCEDDWWRTKTASARWYDFASRSPTKVPFDLSTVFAEVAEQLRPILERLP